MNTRTLLGRTNRMVYPIWARGHLTGEGSAEERAAQLMHALVQSPIETIDITPAVGLWGHFLREVPNRLQVAVVSQPELICSAADARIAANLVQSHLVEVFCAIGRTHVDYYFLGIRETPNETQLSGALEALEVARQEGQIGAVGLAVLGNPLHALPLWRLHDAFEVVLLPDDSIALQTLLPEAHYRRAGVVLQTHLPERAWHQGAQVALLSVDQALTYAR